MDFCKDLIIIGERAKASSRFLMRSGTEIKNKALFMIADELKVNENAILEANRTDLKNAEEKGIKRTLINRLALTSKDLDKICDAVRNVASLPDPVGNGEIWTRPNGLEIHKVSVPIGVIAIIYEARPNVTVDAAALCLKSGNACILRGGSEAFESNKILIETIVKALKAAGLPEGSVQMLGSSDRELVDQLMKMTDYIDLIIPRGGAALIKNIVSNSQVPFIETGTGVCHAFVHEDADLDKAISIVVNAKVDKPEACNALETLLVDSTIATTFLPNVSKALKDTGVAILGCDRTLQYIEVDPADNDDWSTEHLDLVLNVKVVDGLEDALNHIYKYSTKHSEVIITENYATSQRFLKEVDAAAVYVNASTRFTDGARFGFGAEIGISTQKMHARGPMGLPELTTIKYKIYGDGQIVTK